MKKLVFTENEFQTLGNIIQKEYSQISKKKNKDCKTIKIYESIMNKIANAYTIKYSQEETHIALFLLGIKPGILVFKEAYEKHKGILDYKVEKENLNKYSITSKTGKDIILISKKKVKIDCKDEKNIEKQVGISLGYEPKSVERFVNGKRGIEYVAISVGDITFCTGVKSENIINGEPNEELKEVIQWVYDEYYGKFKSKGIEIKIELSSQYIRYKVDLKEMEKGNIVLKINKTN